mmetsp:Transcript_7876/g.13043  ORF Transcript_7876/g.13043 Transcript_7876/m.13043 type:complete len:82 (-) Transcript_7876:32-277(-)
MTIIWLGKEKDFPNEGNKEEEDPLDDILAGDICVVMEFTTAVSDTAIIMSRNTTKAMTSSLGILHCADFFPVVIFAMMVDA